MPEKDDKFSSGIPPERPMPTVIGGQGPKKLQATVIGGGATNVRKPTVIGGGSNATVAPVVPSSPAPPPSIKPSVIPMGVRSPKKTEEEVKVVEKPVIRPMTQPAQQSVKVEKPSFIPGTTRKRLVVTKNDLLMQFPGTSDAVLARAEELLGKLVIETLVEGFCQQWGMREQKRFGELVGQSLELSSHKLIQESSRHVNRLIVILKEVADAFNDDGGGFFSWGKKASPWEKFQEFYPEIRQLSALLNQQIDQIIDIRAKLDGITAEFAKLMIVLDAESISARYLSDMLGTSPDKQSMVQCLLDRSLGLAQTTAQIQQGMIVRQSTVQDIGKLVSRIQDGVLVKLPAWIEQVSTFQSKATLNDTDMYACRQGLEEVTNQIR